MVLLTAFRKIYSENQEEKVEWDDLKKHASWPEKE
jgi:hypothetical protein